MNIRNKKNTKAVGFEKKTLEFGLPLDTPNPQQFHMSAIMIQWGSD